MYVRKIIKIESLSNSSQSSVNIFDKNFVKPTFFVEITKALISRNISDHEITLHSQCGKVHTMSIKRDHYFYGKINIFSSNHRLY